MRWLLLSYLLLLFVIDANAIKVKVTTADRSVNMAEGSIGVFTSFSVYPDNYTNPDSLDLIDFSSIDYNSVAQLMIKKTTLSNSFNSSFSTMANFSKTRGESYGSFTDNNTIQGETYAYRFTIQLNSGQELQLIDKNITPAIANPSINCAKLNNVYRLAGHNTYEHWDKYDFGLYGSLDATRVLELDIHNRQFAPNGNWYVRHSTVINQNRNNCGYSVYVANGSNNLDIIGNKNFDICLDDIKLWHDENSNHDPIVVFIDLKDDFKSSHSPTDLDFILSNTFGADIFKPKDLTGNFTTNVQLAAKNNNWPTIGDLQGKFIFIITGKADDRIESYVSTRRINAVAFTSPSVESWADVVYDIPDIWSTEEKFIVNFNFNYDYIENSIGQMSSSNNYFSRTYQTDNLFNNGDFSYQEFQKTIDYSVNYIAVTDIYNYNNPIGEPLNGIQDLQEVQIPWLTNNHIYSTYEPITQAATEYIEATDLVVENSAHYNMIANEYINLQSGVEFKAGSDVDVTIGDCRYINPEKTTNISKNKLSYLDIQEYMEELKKSLYKQENLESLVGNTKVSIYPNPVNELLYINYRTDFKEEIRFELFDVTGRLVLSKEVYSKSKGEQSVNVNLKEFITGTYFYTLTIGNKEFKGKVIKID